MVHQFAANGSKDPAQWFSVTNPDGSPIFTAPPKGTFNLQPNVRSRIHNPGFESYGKE